MVVIEVIIVPRSSLPYYPKVREGASESVGAWFSDDLRYRVRTQG